MERLLLIPAFALLLMAALLRPSPTSAHWIWCDSVDESANPGEIRWTSTTTYVAQRDFAIAQWNAVGHINIAPDNASTAADLRFYDVNRSDKTWWAKYDCIAIPDKIKFNRARLDPESDFIKRKVAVHELGHALRLGHSFAGQVMQQGRTSVNTPQGHDIQDYCRRWPCLLNSSGGGGGTDSDRRPTMMN
jgi:hypothetical protein